METGLKLTDKVNTILRFSIISTLKSDQYVRTAYPWIV